MTPSRTVHPSPQNVATDPVPSPAADSSLSGFSRAGVFLCVFIYLALALPFLSVPGFHLDEGMYALLSRYVLVPFDFTDPPPLHHYVVWFGRVIPVMAEHYVGPVVHYYLAIFLALFGSSVEAIRLACLLIGAGILAAVYSALRRIFNRRVAFFSVLLLAVDVPFVFVSRLACHREEIFAIFLLWMSILFAAKFVSSRRLAHIAAAGFFFGLGIAVKIIFLWYVGALAGVALLYWRNRPPLRLDRRSAAAAVLALGLGAAPLILYNVSHPGEKFRTVKLLYHSLMIPTENTPAERLDSLKYEHGEALSMKRFVEMTKVNDNQNYGRNLRLRLEQLWNLLAGRLSFSSAAGIRPSGAGLFPAAAFLMAMGFTAAAMFRRRPWRWKAGALPLCLFFFLVLVQTPFTVRGFNMEHMLILWPFPQIAAGLLLDTLWGGFKNRKVRTAVVGTIIVAWTGIQVGANIAYASEAARNGGTGRWSAEVATLSAYLEAKGRIKPVMFGILGKESLLFLSEGRVAPVHCLTGDSAEIQSVFDRIQKPDEPLYYIWAGTPDEDPEARRKFVQFAEARGRAETLEKIFKNGAGRPVYELYRLEAAGTRPGSP
jgi:4-amino-4-deoxy-L-arabinose transferase-like glycosyltransferase